MNTKIVSGTYGSGQTKCKVIVATNRNDRSWYVVKGSVNVNITYDYLDDGVDVEIVSDLDCFTAGKPINTERQLIKEIES